MTNRNYGFVFRTSPSEEKSIQKLAKFASQKGIRSAIILLEKSNSGRRLANLFQTAADKEGIEVHVRQPYLGNLQQEDLRSLLGQIREDFKFDAVFLAQESYHNMVEIIKQAREMGIMEPFIIAHDLDRPELLKLFPQETEGIVVPTTYNPYWLEKSNRDFVNKFLSAFQTLPDIDAVQGYEAIELLAAAFEKSQSTDPRVVTPHMRYALTKWQGICGPYDFDPWGDVIGKIIFFKILRKGEFIYDEVHYTATQKAIEKLRRPSVKQFKHLLS